MTEPTEQKKAKSVQQTAEKKPDWAKGLRQLYDSVVEEPLPDAFADLIAQLDKTGK